jgi:hypothetical protein
MAFYPIIVDDFNRRDIIVLGDYPIEESCFKSRRLFLKKIRVEDVSDSTAEGIFNPAKAIILTANPADKFRLLRECMSSVFPMAENFGVTKRVLVHSSEDVLQTSLILGAGAQNMIFWKETIEDVAENLARYGPGPKAEKVKIEIDGDLRLETEIELLLRRSFFGCDRIYLKSLTGGKASLGVYKVHAWMGKSLVGPCPLPFFAKIAEHEIINRELNNYSEFTDLYINFRYRPNCRIERCTSTKNYSSLVGNFVDEAISLHTALQDSHYSGILFSIFERSLKDLRMQTSVSTVPILNGFFKNFVKDRIKIEDLLKKDDLLSTARSLGLKSDILTVYNRLMDYCTIDCKLGPYHGDLNARNIMVKGNDAILIDFSAVRYHGPLTADPATLEISLCFELGDKFAPPFKKWKAFIKDAYHVENIAKPLPYNERVPSEFSWLRRSVRELRHILVGCHTEGLEMKIILAAYLMRIARVYKQEGKIKRSKLELKYRAYALVTAENIINSMKPEKKGNTVSAKKGK